MSEDGPSRCFGFVQTHDEKPKRRLFELLNGQGMQRNQRVMFFSDGGTDIREVQLYLNPEAEHRRLARAEKVKLNIEGQTAEYLAVARISASEIGNARTATSPNSSQSARAL